MMTGLMMLLCAPVSLLATEPEQDRPNVLILLADDATYTDLPLYGGNNVATPHIDELASQGLTFDRAYLSIAMCTPSRTELYTGLYPARSGVCWNHARARTGTRSIAHHLGDMGYRVGIAGKVHVSPDEVFPFERVPGVTRNSVADVAEYDPAGMRRFMTRDREQPFCLVVGFNSPHTPWTVGDPARFDPETLELPPYMVDTEQTRIDFARYLAELEVLDQQVGRTLALIDETGLAEETVVIFSSEQGAQFPGCKWTNWDSGVHTGLIVRWPGQVSAGGRTEALVQYADVLPTLIDAIGGDPQEGGFDGTSFLPVLRGESDHHREYVYLMHNNIPEGPSYPIRSVSDGTYHYIRNLRPESIYIERHLMGLPEHNPYWSTWMFATPVDPEAHRLVERFMRRPAEQLYNTAEDRFEMDDLADDESLAEVKQRLSAELDRWMQQQEDPAADIDTREAFEAAQAGDHFQISRQPPE